SKPSPSPLASPNPDGPILKQRLVVIGNSRFMTDGLFTQQLNGDVFLNSVTWLSQRTEQVLSIRPKEAKDRRIVLSSLRGNMINVIALLGLPLLGFVMAGILWWKRR
ncbi:MAG: ABC transporter, partial [Synechococcales cyanobacterium]